MAEAPTHTPNCLWFKGADFLKPPRSWDLETWTPGMWAPAECLPQAELWSLSAPLPAGPLVPVRAPLSLDFAQTNRKLPTRLFPTTSSPAGG